MFTSFVTSKYIRFVAEVGVNLAYLFYLFGDLEMVTDDNCVSVCYRWRIGCFMRDIMQLEPGAGRDSPVFTLQKASGLKFSLNIVPRIGRHRGFSSIWLVARDLGGLKSFHFRHIGFWLENSGGKRFGEFDSRVLFVQWLKIKCFSQSHFR